MSKINTKKITRIEVIDHTKDLEDGGGRAFVKWDSNMSVDLLSQDDDRTLKIIISKKDENVRTST